MIKGSSVKKEGTKEKKQVRRMVKKKAERIGIKKNIQKPIFHDKKYKKF